MAADKRDMSWAEQSDEALISAMAERADRAAFAELFRRFAGRVKAFMMRGGAAPEQAEEIAQDVMVKVWQKAASFDGSRAKATTWIYTIARNRRIDLLRREKRAEPDPQDPLFQPAEQPTPLDQAEVSARDARVRSAIAALSTDQRQVVELAFFAGLSHGEIAVQIDAPLGTVKSRLRLAFTRLRGALGETFVEELMDD